MNDYEFSLAAGNDISEIVDIYHSLVGTSGCAWNMDYPDRAMAASDVDRGALYVLRMDGKIIAVVSTDVPDELMHLPWAPKNPCELARLGVAQAMQNQGVGTVLLQNIIETIKKQGFDGIIMLVSKVNPAALALYEKNGFERCGETRMYDVDFYCYQMTFGG